ncbi:MAG: hypothetical protein J6C15_02690 [Bacteroidaceae bacterium]|nr:hypothetical protein [Bacteroidaceae bacterium]
METSAHILQQIERALKKTAAKFYSPDESLPLTDVYLQVKQESGELLTFDDDKELTRCVVEEWIGNNDENFYHEVEAVLRNCILNMKEDLENLRILKPYSFVLIGENKETFAELHLVDDDTILLSEELMSGLTDDLDRFWEELSKKM